MAAGAGVGTAKVLHCSIAAGYAHHLVEPANRNWSRCGHDCVRRDWRCIRFIQFAGARHPAGARPHKRPYQANDLLLVGLHVFSKMGGGVVDQSPEASPAPSIRVGTAIFWADDLDRLSATGLATSAPPRRAAFESGPQPAGGRWMHDARRVADDAHVTAMPPAND